jgi:hypothetical protein
MLQVSPYYSYFCPLSSKAFCLYLVPLLGTNSQAYHLVVFFQLWQERYNMSQTFTHFNFVLPSFFSFISSQWVVTLNNQISDSSIRSNLSTSLPYKEAKIYKKSLTVRIKRLGRESRY